MSLPAEKQQSTLPLFDSHVDLLHSLLSGARGIPFDLVGKGPVTLENMKRGGVSSFLSALYIPDSCNGPRRSSRRLIELLSYNRDYVEPCLSRCMQDAPPPSFRLLLENADALVELGVPFALEHGIVAVGLTHNGANRLADGCHVPSASGLTETGRRLLLEVDRAGIVIDLAHLSAEAFDQVFDLIESPPICTHTGLRRFHDTPRNLSDEQVARVIRRGGVVGLCAAPEMLSTKGTGDIEELFRQFDYLVQRFGSSGIGIGSDFGGFEGGLVGFENHSQVKNLEQRMRRSGYPEGAVAEIFGGGWDRFFGRPA